MCPRTAEQVEQLKGERRLSVLRAARSVFARKGLAAAKISDVAAEAGISYGLVYHYFPQKEFLFAAVVEETVQAWEDLLTQAREQSATPWDRLVFMCSRMMRGVHEEPESLLVVVRAFTEDDAPIAVRDALERYKRQVHEQLAAFVEEGQRHGSVAPGSPSELARALLALIQGLAISRVLDTSGAPPPLEIVLRLLKPGREHQRAPS
jgi:AcrR family transcriptional regulator